jgi:glutamate-1-semialdehyde aminotransferase
MANGFVISAFVGRREIMSMLQPEGPVHFAGTLNASVLGVHVALKMLQILRRDENGIHRHKFALGRMLTDGIPTQSAVTV